MKYAVSIKVDTTGWYEVLVTDKLDLAYNMHKVLFDLLMDGESHGFSAVTMSATRG